MINIKCAEKPADLVDARHQVRRFARLEQGDYHLAAWDVVVAVDDRSCLVAQSRT